MHFELEQCQLRIQYLEIPESIAPSMAFAANGVLVLE